MKKLAIAVTGALALTGIGAAVSAAVDPEISMQASVTPVSHGTKKRPKKAKLVVKLRTTAPAAGETPFAASETVVHLGSELIFNPSAFKTCSKAVVEADDRNCPKGSRVGSGKAQGIALGAVEDLTVRAYNGPNGKLELLVDGSTPLPIHEVIEGSLSGDSAPYGKKLTVKVPDHLQQPAPGAYATLTQFDTTINAIVGKKKKPYVGLGPCKDKKISFKVDYKYNPDGTSKSTETTSPCK